MTRLMSLGIATVIVITLPGCGAMMHEMQPHRLWRWNYHPQSGNSDGSYGAYFSIDDSLKKTQTADGSHVYRTP